MVLWKHELRQNRISLLIWSVSISFMIALCILIFPEMSSDMGDIGAMFADMGSFSAAFGMDRINFGEFVGFFGVECGNVLGIGGAFYAALTGITALSREEKEHTAEFLLTHPVSRRRIVMEKLLAVFVQLLILNLAVIGTSVCSILIIREEVPWDTMALLFAAYVLMQLEMAGITFGMSAFMRRGGPGPGIGAAALFYFLNLAANLTEKMRFLKYFTPLGYTDGADIIAEGAIHAGYLTAGIVLGTAGILAAFYQYGRKDIL